VSKIAKKKNSLKECVSLKIQCHIVKDTLLQTALQNYLLPRIDETETSSLHSTTTVPTTRTTTAPTTAATAPMMTATSQSEYTTLLLEFFCGMIKKLIGCQINKELYFNDFRVFPWNLFSRFPRKILPTKNY